MSKADMFLKLDGKSSGAIKGESSAVGHADEIEILGWSWGMSGPNTLGGAGAASRVALSELRITKSVDRASTALMSVMRSNEQIKKAVLSVRKAGVSPPFDYLTVTIERGRITAFDLANTAPDSPEMVEHFSIAFEKIDISYAMQNEKGAKTAASSFSAEVN